MSIGDRDFITSEELAKALGAHRHAGYWMAKCPAHDDRVPSLSLRDGDNGRPVFRCHAGCSQTQVLEALRALGLWPDHGERREWRPPPPKLRPREPDNAARAREIWAEGSDPRGTLVETYLSSRGLTLSNDIADRVIRYHGNCPFRPGQRVQCLVARFSPIRNDHNPEVPPTAIHRIRLDRFDGEDRKLSFGPSAGQTIKLSHDEDIANGLGIAEGIETGLSVMRVGFRPVWALATTSAIKSFPVLEGIQSLVIFGDNDRNQAGQRAASACKTQWQQAGREVRVFIPRTVGSDWNDEVLS